MNQPDSYQQLQSRAEQAERDSMINALAAANADSEAGKVEFQTSWQNGDLAGAAEAQERISRAQARAVTLESGIEGFDERQHGSGYVAQQQYPQQQQRLLTTTDVINSMTNLSARERQWLMQHQELVSTPAGQSRLQTAYYDTQDKGIQRDSDQYFDYFNDYFGFQQNNNYSSARSSSGPPQGYIVGGPSVQRQYQSPSKPYTPETPRVSLTEKEAAKISGVDEATYQANKKKLQDLKKLGYYADR
jgi:hypothetical protein